MTSQLKKTILLVVVICSSFFYLFFHQIYSIHAANANQGVTVNLTVPVPGSTGGGGTGGGPGGSDVPPVIFALDSFVSFTTATVSWSATDDLGVVASSFVYGPTISYGNSGLVTGSYKVDLLGLATGTLYYFKILAIDTGSHTTEYTGTFSTSPPPADTAPPLISNIQVTAGITAATITWDTNELADSQINYGLTNSYGSNYFDVEGKLTHSVLLFNLTPNTTYHFQIISTDSSGNSGNTPDATFTTQADSVAPPDVSGFLLTTTTNSIVLSWTNPSLAGTIDFNLVKVLRKVGTPSVSPVDGTVVYTGAGENFTDFSVAVNTDYFYTIFSFDTSGNYSPGIFRNGKILPSPIPGPFEICDNGLDDNGNGSVDCADIACVSFPACIIVPPPTSTPPAPVPEICNNGNDDDLNGQIDCADSACSGYVGCLSLSTVAVCNNGLDDDGDGIIDYPADPGCSSAEDTDEYNPPEPTIPPFAQIYFNDLIFLAGNRQIKLEPLENIITGLSGANFSLVVPENILASAPRTMILRVGGTDQHQFVFNTTDRKYYADLSFFGVGESQAYLEIDYGSGQLDSVGFKLNSLPWGQVVDEDGKAIPDAEITLLETDGSAAQMGNYGQLNPILSDANGSFGWMVLNGDFKITIYKEGYYNRSFTLSNISNHVVNAKFVLITRPIKLDLTDTPANIIKALGSQTKILSNIVVQKVQDAVTNPEVQQANQQIVAPATITVVSIGAITLISWLDFLPLLRLLFLQPLMLLGWRKREKWGLVYNSLNKLPIDLATVRLISLETNRVIQSKVTDTKGRFLFMVDQGKYRLEVQKNSFIFPSKFLEGYKSDGQKVDIYHNEPIEVLKPASITANVPLDPVGAQKKPLRLVLEKFGRKLQVVLSWIGIIVTAASLYISPKWYIVALLVLHIVLFLIFRRLAVPPKPKNWGIVYDDTNKAPVGRVVARLFNSQFNKLVDTQITDSSGKYYFMAGDGKYYVTYEHKEYHPEKTDIIDLAGKDAEVITVDVKLKKN